MVTTLSGVNRDYSDVIIDGPWDHEFVSAHGARFHVVTAGMANSGPLITLVHTTPLMWWQWRHTIPALADAGWRVAALDMRGTGASDKPPTGYDQITRTRDVAGVIRSLGASKAIIVGHGLGAVTAWSMPSLQPAITVGVAALSAPHPARLHASLRTSLNKLPWRRLPALHLPSLGERTLTRPETMSRLFTRFGHQPVPGQVIDTYANALRIPFAAHNSLEPLRWYTKGIAGPVGRRYLQGVRTGITVPALQLQGAHDGLLRRELIAADSSALCSNLRFETISDAGFFLTEEVPNTVNDLLIDWLSKSFPQ